MLLAPPWLNQIVDLSAVFLDHGVQPASAVLPLVSRQENHPDFGELRADGVSTPP